jgi:hypothetical protein
VSRALRGREDSKSGCSGLGAAAGTTELPPEGKGRFRPANFSTAAVVETDVGGSIICGWASIALEAGVPLIASSRSGHSSTAAGCHFVPSALLAAVWSAARCVPKQIVQQWTLVHLDSVHLFRFQLKQIGLPCGVLSYLWPPLLPPLLPLLPPLPPPLLPLPRFLEDFSPPLPPPPLLDAFAS